MAVFTKLNRDEINNFISGYDLGNLDTFSEIVEGIENTNYKVVCNGVPYILTIFERRVNNEDLPFFIELKIFLNKNNFKCPQPIKNRKGEIINSLKNKKAVITSFIEGKKIQAPNKNDCYEIGKIVGQLHHCSSNFNKKRYNSLNISELRNIFNKCKNENNEEFNEIYDTLDIEIKFLEKAWPINLPSGIIHADLFRDNVFFDKGQITGVIDFYFSCNHYFLYDLSIVINDWCFENNGGSFNKDLFDSVMRGYNLSRNLEKSEIEAFNLILRVAAVRILVTRLHDCIFHPNDAVVVKKDPYQYLNILQWHHLNKVLEL